MKTVFEAYPEIEAYVLEHIDPVDLTEALECYQTTIKNDRYSMEYTFGCVPLSDKIEELLNEWIKENVEDRGSFLIHIESRNWWMWRDVEGSFHNLIFRLFEKVLQTKGII